VHKGEKKKQEIRIGDYLLLLLYAYNEAPIKGRTRLQKAVFLLEKEALKRKKNRKNSKLVNTFSFFPYNYGPFSKKLMEFVELFENLELIKIKEEALDDEGEDDNTIFMNELLQIKDLEWVDNLEIEDTNTLTQPVYIITEKGKNYLREHNLPNNLDLTTWNEIQRIKKFCVSNPLKIILKYVYIKYPESANNSKIREKLLKETEWQF